MDQNQNQNKNKNNKSTMNIQCCFCGPVRNCAPFLPAVMRNIQKMGSQLFHDQYAIILFYDKSSDISLSILKTWKIKLKKEVGVLMHLYINPATTLSPYRTHRISAARNKCLDILKNNYSTTTCPYFIMMDFDEPNSKPCHPENLQKYFDTTKSLLNKWDALSFQTAPHYYDIWALSIAPFSFSYNHFRNNDAFYGIIQTYMDKKLAKTKGLVSCISAFNGFAIYKTAVFLSCRYSGDIRTSTQLSKNIQPRWIQQHKRATQSKQVEFRDYGHIKGAHEDCEHRPFHMQAIQQNGARIKISPEVIFI
jgi:hypothetical protein